ncbi:MAG: hypothetical protein JXA33_04985 [Anaerolineae bacterium]|nr:hypothetical protein [Anaerolineae bacterium]
MKVWQIATGEPGRNYKELFFDHDVMILGCRVDLGDALEKDYIGVGPNACENQVYSFARKPEPGDRVIMRFANEAIGIGQIPEPPNGYSFNESFRCVYGWDLCHCRRVAWAKDYNLGDLVKVFKSVKQRPSFTQVHEECVVDMVQAIDDEAFTRPLEAMPDKNEYEQDYTEDSLGLELFRAGISSKNIEDILKALQQAAMVCSWYESEQKDCASLMEGKKEGRLRTPSEHEIISHVILPLFLGLGWSHQQMGVEWQRVDMAFFKTAPRTKENCVMVLEAKGLGSALSNVLDQPINYVRELELSNVKYILTTDGVNLFVYHKSGGDWDRNPFGYINVSRLRKKYILPRGIDLVKTLVKLQPSMV